LKDRARIRGITADDMGLLTEWIVSIQKFQPRRCYKDFGSFKLAGEGNLPKTLLRKDQAGLGTQLP
jgi:hypothetical protein